MDPVACLMRPDRREAYRDMREWIRKGGYLPTVDQMRVAGCSATRVTRLVRLGFVRF